MKIYAAHAEKYPLMQPQDAVKLAYQRTFGGGHMIPNPEMALARLKKEIAETEQTDAPLLEDIGSFYRLNLHAFANSGLRAETVSALFVYTANHTKADAEKFGYQLTALRACANHMLLPFDRAALDTYLAAYEAEGCPAVSHTDIFRENYAPAYRLVPEYTQKLLPVLREMDRILLEKGEVTLGIDGMCGSGKSTLAAFLAEITGAQLIHMDDYFLPFERKTPERLAQPGGNVDYERFAEEVVGKPLDKPLRMRAYSCSTGTLGDWQELAPSRVRIVEGSYCMHPHFGNPYDVRMYMTASPTRQMVNLKARDGKEMWERFKNEWIPMENAYEQAFGISKNCIIVES